MDCRDCRPGVQRQAGGTPARGSQHVPHNEHTHVAGRRACVPDAARHGCRYPWPRLEQAGCHQRGRGVDAAIQLPGFDGQGAEDGASAAEVPVAVDGLIAAIDANAKKLPARKATRAMLEEVRAIQHWADQHLARVNFEVEF